MNSDINVARDDPEPEPESGVEHEDPTLHELRGLSGPDPQTEPETGPPTPPPWVTARADPAPEWESDAAEE